MEIEIVPSSNEKGKKKSLEYPTIIKAYEGSMDEEEWHNISSIHTTTKCW